MRDVIRRMLVAERNPDIVAWLARLGFATPSQVSALVARDGRQPSTIERRLRELRVAGITDRVLLRLHHTQRREAVYFLTRRGAYAAARLLHDAEVLRWLRRLTVETVHVRHHLAVNDLLIRLLQRLGEGVEAVPKHRLRLRWRYGGVWHQVTPDAVILLPTGGAFVIEYDRGTRYLPDLRKQVRRYAELASVADLPEWARGTIVYVLEDPSPSRRDAILEAAGSGGIADRCVVVPLDDLDLLVEAVT